MIIVDNAMARRVAEARPIRFGLFGAGFMGRGIINQGRYTPGLRCAALCNRTVDKALATLHAAGITAVEVVDDVSHLDNVIEGGGVAVTDDPELLCRSQTLEALIEATGHIAYGAQVALLAIEHGKHTVLMNAEVDATIGPLLKHKADRAGVLISGSDGDQPAVEMNLHRFVKALGLEPLVCGNIKGLQDRYRNPTTQEAFAKRWGQTPSMVTSFADGTKISFEQAVVANATGMRVQRRGMIGLEHDGHVDELVDRYDISELRKMGGVVDYVVGARPSPGVFVLAACHDAVQAQYLDYGKLGSGPLYSFYTPYHLTVLEASLTVVRLVELGDVAIAPTGRPVVDVIAAAKTDLMAGATIDGVGGYMTYGLCENYDTVRRQGLLPIGLAEGSVLLRDIARDEPISADDVQYPPDSLLHGLRDEQDSLYPVEPR